MLKIAREDGAQPLAAYLQTPEGRSRVRALHHLAGGNHRVYIVLAELIDRESLDELVGPFEKMVDELTPYYQERLRWLAPQQRRIVELLCTQTAPLPVKAIARQLFATEQTVAAQLKRLRELGYVVRETRGRESLYELTEPLMRLSYEVKENRREPLRLIVDFLRIWYHRALAIDGARFLAAFNRVGMLFCRGRFECGFTDLEAALAKHWPNSEDYAGDVPVMLEAIWKGNDEPQPRRSLADRLIRVYAGANLLAYLGDGLVSSLETWKTRPVLPNRSTLGGSSGWT